MLLILADIYEWLADNETAFRSVPRDQPPPLDNGLYFMYQQLEDFVSYLPFVKSDLHGLEAWANIHEELGAKSLLIFPVTYLNWTEPVDDDAIKIGEGLFTEKKPLEKLIAFCEAFQRWYWTDHP